ncbi:type II secretion system protein M [Buttiauxella sp. S19-1]|uniref:type II secretion system protein M n=1 Tax=Buttiauxella sp. S19-1 TaxID=941430 RepID=UPI001EDA4CCE|nr:type II secretion system protein M [Buttiauxella sp. S19-1]
MPWLIERWFSGAHWVRVVTFTTLSSMVILAVWLLLVVPQHSQIQQLQANSMKASQQLALLRHKIRQLAADEQPVMSSNSPVFSVVEFVRQADGQLVKWQPEERSAVLTMLVPWEKLPGLFIWLAEYRVVADHSFTITAQGELLNLVLGMEFADDP